MNILLTVAYDGTNYAGWQMQKNAMTVQQRLGEALSALLKTEINLTAASRTDAGVHALGQKASFKIDYLPIPLKKLPQVINGCLPDDISILDATAAADDFNPRFDAKCKQYHYQIYNAVCPNPLTARYSAFIPRELSINKMAEAAAHFTGTHDFSAFCSAGSSAKTTVRTVFSCDVVRENGFIIIKISGDGFLYNMVRIVSGTVVYAGLGKIDACCIPSIIKSRNREKAGKTMPPQGLILMEVLY